MYLIFFLVCIPFAYSDEYLIETMISCESSKSLLDCFKYRIIKYLTKVVLEEEYLPLNISGYIEVIKVKSKVDENDEESARYFPNDDQITKFWKYVQRLENKYLANHALKVKLPTGSEIISDSIKVLDEGRRRKNNKVAIIPMLTLLKIFKIKFLLAAVLLTLIFIKKAIFLSALLFPYYLHQIKEKAPRHTYPHHHEEYYEYEYEPHHGTYPEHYSKDWSRGSLKRM
ncbi:uncharacterized protein LOC108742016 [Agrilus planipennis]|uniref:Uncharacterized protein LOC108742016 n=1 Tax=Agrilus planipennis TaxID=224129 RepID=A0A1W4X8U1_AGRPL|nr:uncharacterized protein LOC108742016 [Agrilus planipennis]